MALPLMWLDPSDTGDDIFSQFRLSLLRTWPTRRARVRECLLALPRGRLDAWQKHVETALVPNQQLEFKPSKESVSDLRTITLGIANKLLGEAEANRLVLLSRLQAEFDSLQNKLSDNPQFLQAQPYRQEGAPASPVLDRWNGWVESYCLALIYEMLRMEIEKPQYPQPPHMCVVCFSHNISVLYKPCKHRAVCQACDQQLTSRCCPMCRCPIQDAIVFCRIVG